VERDLNLEFSGNQRKDEPHGCAKSDCLFCKVFGPHKKTKHELGPSRLIVRDAFLTAECRAEFQRDPDRLLDVRTENMVNRLSNTATNPRPVERVARGVTFDLEMVVRLQQGDDREEILAMLKRGLELMQQDGVGGGASRGNGKIRIEVTEPAEWAVRN
jgi:CRISPR-associated protein Csm3